MRKYIIITTIALCSVGLLHAQSYEDALKYSQNIYEGTARFQGMGGAFSALGGDFTTLSINPAGVGVYRIGEITITPTVMITSTSTDYLSQTSKETRGKFGLGNLGLVWVLPTPNETVRSVNFGFGFNKLQNNTQRFSAYGVNNSSSFAQEMAKGMTGLDYRDIDNSATSTEWLSFNTYLVDTMPGIPNQYWAATEDENLNLMGPLKQAYYRDQSGFVGEYVFNLGLNLSDRFYVGMTFGIQDISNYLYEEYAEAPQNTSQFTGTGFQKMVHTLETYTGGVGYNLKFGAIARPVDGLRIGAYIHTPTWMYLSDNWTEGMATNFGQGMYYGENGRWSDFVQGGYDYQINAPFKWGAGVAYTFGNRGLISVDYEGVDYSATTMYGRNDRSAFTDDNEHMSKSWGTTTNIRAGAELRLVDEFSVRAGYAYYQNPEKEFSDTHMGSVGLGYRGQYFFADLAYSFIPSIKQEYVPYWTSDRDPNVQEYMNTSAFYSKIMLTLGFRF